LFLLDGEEQCVWHIYKLAPIELSEVQNCLQSTMSHLIIYSLLARVALMSSFVSFQSISEEMQSDPQLDDCSTEQLDYCPESYSQSYMDKQLLISGPHWQSVNISEDTNISDLPPQLPQL